MFLRPLRRMLALAASACAVLLFGCYTAGDSAPPPVGGLTVTEGDQLITLTWQMDSDVQYWLFWGPGSNVDVTHATFIKTNIGSPYTIEGLTNGATYAFTINGRKDGGPGGAAAPVVTGVPRPTGIVWQIGGAAGSADLKGVAYGGTYNVVGNAGTLFQSPDGITWTAAAGNWAAQAGVTNINAIIFTLAGYIVVGDAGLILRSSDNVNWTPGTYATPPATASRLNALGSNGSRVVAVGDGGTIYYSDDNGSTWNNAAAVPAGTGNLYGVTSSTAGRWVAVGAAGTVITSTDGSTWVAVTSVTPAITTDLRDVAVISSTSIFTAVGVGGEVITSTDALVWTSQVITPNDLLSVAPSVAGTALFVAVGRAGVAFTSFDGITWTARTTGTLADLFGLVSGGGQFIAVGQAGTTLHSR